MNQLSMITEFEASPMSEAIGPHLYIYHVGPLSFSIYMNYPHLFNSTGITTPELVHHINSILLNCKKNNVDLTICDDFHVSLTRTVVLRHHWIEGFNSSIRKQIEDFTR